MRKLPDSDARTIRRDYIQRTNAARALEEAKRVLATVPTPAAHAKRMGIHHTRAYHIAQGLAYKDLVL